MTAANVLVTGATGFVRRSSRCPAVVRGDSVTVLVRSSSVLPAEWRDRVVIVVCDDFSEKNLRQLTADPFEAVFHLAAYGVMPNQRDIDEILRINIEMPAVLVRLCARNGAQHGDDGHLF